MSESTRWKSIVMVSLLLLSPWLLVQGWILVSAPTPEHTQLPVCPEGTQNCASDLWDAFESWSSDEHLAVEYDRISEDGEYFSHRIAITSFWRFPDDVVVKFTPVDDNSSVISLYSSSRLGVSDLGVNPDRLADLHEALMQA